MLDDSLRRWPLIKPTLGAGVLYGEAEGYKACDLAE